MGEMIFSTLVGCIKVLPTVYKAGKWAYEKLVDKTPVIAISERTSRDYKSRNAREY